MPTTPTILLANALSSYAEGGYHLTPLSGKIALVKGWPSTDFEPFPSLSDYPTGNFGIVLQPDDLVIDVDPRNFKDGIDSFKAFKEKLGGLPSTFSVRTGAGGYHLYYKKPGDFHIKGALREFPGIEFKTHGQYVVGYASIHPDTRNPYQLISKTPSDVAKAPEVLLELIKRQEILPATGTAHYTDDSQTIERFKIYLNKAPIAIEGESGDKTTFSIAATAHDFGLHPDKTLELMLEFYNPRCQPHWDAEALKKKVYNAYKYAGSVLGNASPLAKFELVPQKKDSINWDTTSSGKYKGTLKNAAAVFLMEGPLFGVLGFNLFTHNIVFLKPAPWHKEYERVIFWSDEEALRAKFYLATMIEHSFEAPTPIIHEAARIAAAEQRFHPVKDYLESLKWDGHKRLHNWLHTFLGAEDNEYTRNVGLKFMVAAAKRIYQPGCKFDYIMVLEGPQGIMKSTVFRVLADPWFAELVLSPGDKDCIIAMFGKWIIELAEMETHRRTETTRMKAFLSNGKDTIRMPYSRVSEDVERSSVFVGTINPEGDDDLGYLKDTTGNRRYWPIVCGNIRLDPLRDVRDQLWAEALVLYKQGVKIYLEDSVIEKMASVEQKKRQGVDPWFQRITEWANHDPVYSLRMVITSQEVFTDCLGGKLSLFARREQARISNIMLELAWVKGVHYHPTLNTTVRGFRRPTIE